MPFVPVNLIFLFMRKLILTAVCLYFISARRSLIKHKGRSPSTTSKTVRLFRSCITLILLSWCRLPIHCLWVPETTSFNESIFFIDCSSRRKYGNWLRACEIYRVNQITILLIQEIDNSEGSPSNPDDEIEIDAAPPSNVDISKVIVSMIRMLLSLGRMSKQETLLFR